MKRTNQSKHHMQKSSPFLSLGLGMVAAGTVINMLLGGMKKMDLFGNEKEPQNLAKQMMAGAVEGILEHFEWKIDELKRESDRLNNKNADLLKEREEYKMKYEELFKKKK